MNDEIRYFFIRRPVLAGVISIVITLLGAFAMIRLPINRQALHDFVAGNETSGRLRMPLISLHTTGDGQVPIEQARRLREANRDRLVGA